MKTGSCAPPFAWGCGKLWALLVWVRLQAKRDGCTVRFTSVALQASAQQVGDDVAVEAAIAAPLADVDAARAELGLNLLWCFHAKTV